MFLKISDWQKPKVKTTSFADIVLSLCTSSFVLARWYNNYMYTVPPKNDTDVWRFSFDVHQPILVIFGRFCEYCWLTTNIFTAVWLSKSHNHLSSALSCWGHILGESWDFCTESSWTVLFAPCTVLLKEKMAYTACLTAASIYWVANSNNEGWFSDNQVIIWMCLVRWGGKNYHLIAYSLFNISAKNYQNWLTYIENVQRQCHVLWDTVSSKRCQSATIVLYCCTIWWLSDQTLTEFMC